MTQILNHWDMKDATEINQALDALPIAEKLSMKALNSDATLQDVEDFRTIKVTMPSGKQHFVSCPSKKYYLVQHKDAFNPIKEGLTLAGCHDFKFIMTATPARASMQIYTVGQADDGVYIGIQVSNSYNSSKALSYGFQLGKAKSYIEVVGYRQVCSNGMKMRVPLNQAEFIREEKKTELQILFKQYASIRHTKGMETRILAMQYITEALNLLREPINAMIRAGKEWNIDTEDKLTNLVKKHVGKRFQSKVLEQYQKEDKTLWGLYNAMTFVASHDVEIKPRARETLVDKASNMLTTELVTA